MFRRSQSRSPSISSYEYSSDEDKYFQPTLLYQKTKPENELQVLLASLMVLRNNTHTYHWFITGKNFVEVHTLLNQQYDQILLNADRLAEYMIANKLIGNTSLSHSIKLSKVQDRKATIKDNPFNMIADLLEQHKIIYKMLQDMDAKSRVLDNILADFQEYHKKQIWFFESILSE